MKRFLTRFRQADCGAAAIEFALVGMVAIALFFGILELGRALYMRNEMSYAADLATRQILNNPAVTDADLQTVIRNAISFGPAGALQITTGTQDVSGIAFRTLQIRTPVSLLIPTLADGRFVLTVERRIPVD